MWPCETSVNEQTLPLPVKLDACPCAPRNGHLPPAAWQQSVSTVDLVELVDELAKAYETSLRLHVERRSQGVFLGLLEDF